MTSEHTIRKSYEIDAPLDFVWECLADEDTCGLWQGGEVTIGQMKGSKVELFGGTVIGKITKYQPDNLLEYTWRGEKWDRKWEPSVVKYTLTVKDDYAGTIVELLHRNLPNEEERESHAMGWDEYFFDLMIEFIHKSS